ncbi:Uncharacterized protein SCF082_LOCUS53075 [Durusdinium trenchii]|uniref:Methyltransferase FkbM domain-containing protein n=1 Tax=Durusdinium trenchii TaxID=1381693 RepID=A0ABP0SQC1_9DINO
MPWLIRFALDDSEGHGLAIDVGAGDSGSCTWPLLSEGHVVHMFETGYVNQLERDFIELTRDVNGWQERATLHGPVQDDLYMAELLKSAEKIHLLKIDVDDRPSYEAVFAGVAPVLNKTEILQIEMIEEEIGRDGMLWIMETFHSFGFDFYGLEDLETFPRYQHDSLGRACEHGDVEGRHHSAAVEDGTMPYEYGADGPKHLRMFPICQCGAKVVGGGRGNKDPLKCRAQFAFVRRAGHVARPRVQERFGRGALGEKEQKLKAVRAARKLKARRPRSRSPSQDGRPRLGGWGRERSRSGGLPEALRLRLPFMALAGKLQGHMIHQVKEIQSLVSEGVPAPQPLIFGAAPPRPAPLPLEQQRERTQNAVNKALELVQGWHQRECLLQCLRSVEPLDSFAATWHELRRSALQRCDETRARLAEVSGDHAVLLEFIGGGYGANVAAAWVMPQEDWNAFKDYVRQKPAESISNESLGGRTSDECFDSHYLMSFVQESTDALRVNGFLAAFPDGAFGTEDLFYVLQSLTT